MKPRHLTKRDKHQLHLRLVSLWQAKTCPSLTEKEAANKWNRDLVAGIVPQQYLTE